MKNKNIFKTKPLNPQGLLICPICGKEFTANDDTKYIIGGGYTCSWKCFLNEARKQSAERQAMKNKAKKLES